MARILLFANTTWYLYNFRLGLARAARQAGHEVILVGPPDEYGQRLIQMGFCWVPLALRRRGLNPLVESATLLRCVRLYRRLKPDLVHHFTVKPVVYGTHAARLAGIRRVVNSVAGLGHAFLQRGMRGQVLRALAAVLYRSALRHEFTRTVFENPTDLLEFVRLGLVPQPQAIVVPGSGLDLDRYRPVEEPGGTPVVLLASRMLWEKGIADFVQAARGLKEKGVVARFLLAGNPDCGNPSSIPEAQLRRWAEEGVVEWLGQQEEMPELYAGSNIVVLPSLREGLPRTLVEAAASARAIVATDVPGCRDVVRHGVNGLLVPPRNPDALAEAIHCLLADADLRRSMGMKGREFVEQELADGPVNSAILRLYEDLLQPSSVKEH